MEGGIIIGNTVEEITEAHQLYKYMEEEANAARIRLANKVKGLDIAEFARLSYSEMKEIKPCLKYYLEKVTEAKVDEIYKLKRETEYPELKKAIYYPELNQIDFFSLHQIKELDILLAHTRVGNFVHHKIEEFCRDENIYQKITDFLCQYGIVSKNYRPVCPECGEDGDILTDEEYEKMKAAYGKIYGEWTDEDCEYAWHYWYCDECDEDQRIETKEQFEKQKFTVIYKLKKEADRSTDSL